MSNVICIAGIRAQRVKEALNIHCRKGEAIVIETRQARVLAERLICRERFAEVLDAFGNYFVIDYNDIISLHTNEVAQTSVVNARGEFFTADKAAATSRPVTILPFEQRPRRKQSAS
jgi:hypothetical protein